MLEAVKTPHTDKILLNGNTNQIPSDDDEELVNVFETDWYREIKAQITPKDIIKMREENAMLKAGDHPPIHIPDHRRKNRC